MLQQEFMAGFSIFSKIVQWLQSTEMFARPAKQLPGKWQLYEYYAETDGGLINYKQQQIDELKQQWNIEFTPDYQFIQFSSLNLLFIKNNCKGKWRIKKNYLEIELDSSDTVSFQFAIEIEQLKLLKKDSTGKIDFFGFFRRVG